MSQERQPEQRTRFDIKKVADIIPGLRTEMQSGKYEHELLSIFGALRLESFAKNFFKFVQRLEGSVDSDSNAKEFIDGLKRLRGQVVVELGAGSSPMNAILAKRYGARAYVGTDPVNAEDLEINLRKEGLLNDKRIEVAVVPEDALTILKRLPDKSVSIMVSGLDNDVLHAFDDEYVMGIRVELERVLHPDGVFVQDSSDISPEDWSKFDRIKGTKGLFSYDNLFIPKR